MASQVEQKSRIIYVDPNDVYHTFQDEDIIPLTPPYEDFCIAFNLTVQTFSRYKENTVGTAKNNKGKEFTLSWVSSNEIMDGKHQAAFLRGSNFKVEGGDTYLTTYYTDISFGNYGTQTIVEGLGVEQIQIKFESWYTPTIVIKFVDVRGSAIWGNEEAIHNGKGEITADNIFGCFFTTPYPLFRLQIKGFLGEPVTYQLTCSSFKGEYNSNNGNFEATATFIGYSYSLLTDIPFEYLIAAPMCDYTGRAYWEKHCNSAEWALDDGRSPIMLTKLFEEIRRRQKDIKETLSGITDTDNNELKNISNERTLLRNIRDCISKFIDEVSSVAHGRIYAQDDETKYMQLLLFFNKGNQQVGITDDTMNVKMSGGAQVAFQKLSTAIDEYTNCFPNISINKDKLPNQLTTLSSDITTIRTIDIKQEEGQVVSMTFVGLGDGQDKTVTNIKKIPFNDGRTLITPLAQRLYDGSNTPTFDTTFGEFCYLFDMHDLTALVQGRLDNLTKDETSIKRRVTDKLEEDILTVLSIKPYIGNIFKIIMCHLETFLHILYDASDAIDAQAQNGLRSSDYLNINLSNTDIVEGMTDHIPAWPDVVNNGVETDQGGYYDASNNCLGWVGDFSHNFIEEEVVLSIQAALRRIMDNHQNGEKATSNNYFPIAGADFINGYSPFQYIGDITGADSMAGYIGIRAAQIFGVLCDSAVQSNVISLIAKMDAYNYYGRVGSGDAIQSDIFKQLGAVNAVDTMLGIAMCNPSYDSYGGYTEGKSNASHTFEIVPNIKYNQSGRHPMISKDGSSYVFAHYYDKDGSTLVPADLEAYDKYADVFTYTQQANYSDCYFSGKYAEGINGITGITKKWLHTTNTITIIPSDVTFEYEDYLNRSMFSIIDGDSALQSVTDCYLRMKTGSVEVQDLSLDEDYSSYLSDFWLVGTDDYSKWFDSVKTNLSLNRSDLNVKDENLLSLELYNNDVPKSFKDNDTWLNVEKNVIRYEGGKYYQVNGSEKIEKSIDELTIQQFVIHHNVESSGNLFGCPFYYMQNNYISDNEEVSAYTDRVLHVKALLFLHTFNYDYTQVPSVFKFSKHNGTVEAIPYGMALFYGALLWRSRYIAENGVDPIIYKETPNEYKSAYDKENDIEYTLFLSSDGVYEFSTIKKQDARQEYKTRVSELFGYYNAPSREEWLPDLNIMNQLVNLFDTFVKDTFNSIASTFEIHSQKVVNGDVTNKTVEDYTFNTLQKDIETMSKNYLYSSTNWTTTTILGWIRNNGFVGWDGVYRMVYVSDKNNPDIFNMLLEETNAVVKTCKEIYTKRVVFVDSCYRRLNQVPESPQEITIPTSVYNEYATTFLNTLKSIVEKTKQQQADVSTDEGSEKLRKNRDYSITIYYYLKHLWDKWLIPYREGDDQTTFDVSKFFKNNFIFIDSFYRNAYKLHINCDVLMDIYDGLSDDGTLFTFLDQLVSKHHCIFFSLPDYIGFDGNGEKDVQRMEKVFTPMPFSEIGDPEPHNKFVIIWTNKPSEIADDFTGYKTDGFDIWSYNEQEDKVMEIFKAESLDNTEERDDVTRFGYNIPSFGVSFSRQNNHIFKSIKIGMDNPVVTEQSARAYENVILKGRNGERRVVFHGQDIYSVFSSYSYSCTVEMLGDAQICPLMYFQLLNIPMWHGTYMIYSVTHTMTPGNMITSFNGMKMSRRPMPFATSFFTIGGEYASMEEPSLSDSGGGIYGDMAVELNSSYKQVAEPNVDHFSDPENWQSKAKYNSDYRGGLDRITPAIIRLYNQLFEEISLLDENRDKPTWNVQITNVLSYSSQTSDHRIGNAVDLKVMRYDKDGKNPSGVAGVAYMPELLKAVDVLYSNHKNDVHQVILEYDKDTDMDVNSCYRIFLLHVGANTGNGAHEFFIAAKNKQFSYINKGRSGSWFLERVTPEFKEVAKKAYYNDRQFFTKQFKNYSNGNYTDSELNSHFGYNDYVAASSETSKDESDRIKTAMEQLKKFPYNSRVGICANLLRESDLLPDAKQKGGPGLGICQWSYPSRITMVVSMMNEHYNTNYNTITDFTLEMQIYGMMEEMKLFNVYSTFLNSMSASEAAELFLSKYEMSKNQAKDQQKNIANISKIQSIVPS